MVTQGSLLDWILFHIFLVQSVNFASYADENTIDDAGDNIDEIIFSLQESSKKLCR